MTFTNLTNPAIPSVRDALHNLSPSTGFAERMLVVIARHLNDRDWLSCMMRDVGSDHEVNPWQAPQPTVVAGWTIQAETNEVPASEDFQIIGEALAAQGWNFYHRRNERYEVTVWIDTRVIKLDMLHKHRTPVDLDRIARWAPGTNQKYNGRW